MAPPPPAFAPPVAVPAATLSALRSSFVCGAGPARAPTGAGALPHRAAAGRRSSVHRPARGGAPLSGRRAAAPPPPPPPPPCASAAAVPRPLAVVVSGSDDAGIVPAILSAAAVAGARVTDVQAAALGHHLTLAVGLDVADAPDAEAVVGALSMAATAVGATVVAADAAGVAVAPPALGGGGSPTSVAAAAAGLVPADADSELLSPSDDAATASTAPPPAATYVVTLLAEEPLPTPFLAGLHELLNARGAGVRRIRQLARTPLRAMEVVVALPAAGAADGDGADHNGSGGGGHGGGDGGARVAADTSAPAVVDLRKALYRYCRASAVDMALQADTVYRRAKRLVVMDMDSTLIRQEVIDELARHAGVYEAVRGITDTAMEGGMDFNESLRQRVALLAGTPADAFDKVIANLVYTEGASVLCGSLHQLGVRLAVISGGFTTVASHVRRELGLDYDYANTLEVGADGAFTGRTVGPVVNSQRKADLLVAIADAEGIPMDQVVAIGDGANDLQMLSVAGLGLAFNAKPAVQDAATFVLNQSSLASVLYLLGYSEGEQEALAARLPSPADAAAAATAAAAAAAATAAATTAAAQGGGGAHPPAGAPPAVPGAVGGPVPSER